MLSAFGVDHGEVAKALGGEYGFNSVEGRKRTMKHIKRDSRMSAGHGNKQRLAANTAVGTGLGAGLGALSTAGSGGGPKWGAAGAGIGAGAGALFGASAGKGENLQRSAARNIDSASKRGDVRRLKHGERGTSFRNIITKD